MSRIDYPSKFVRYTTTYSNESSIETARDLVKFWTEAEDDDSSILTPIEANTIRTVLGKSKSEMEAEINSMMSMDIGFFENVNIQLESLTVFWERIMLIKRRLESLKRRDEVWRGGGKQHKFRGKDAMDTQCCLLGLTIIPRRLNIGLSMLPVEDMTSFTEDESKRERETKRSTSPGKAFLRDPSEESAAAEDLASSEESTISKKGEHSGRKNAKGSARSKVGHTRREEIEKIIKKELAGPLEDKYWEGKLPKGKRGGRSVKDSTTDKQPKSAVAEDSSS
ncbi:hypothetical protein F5883DRAFT_654723 [Diaporthe sp. PMI_573]|nr:hypothetical protein F5883DRAFT_654723 [Diaporthaceae sp. PMI_573]